MGVKNPSVATSEEQAEVTLASSSSSTDIFNQTSNNIYITGTTTITTFPAAPRAGMRRLLRFSGNLTLTHGSGITGFGNSSVSCYTGSLVEVVAITTTTFRCLSIWELSSSGNSSGAWCGSSSSANTNGAAIGVYANGSNGGFAGGYNSDGSSNGVAIGYNAIGSGNGFSGGYGANTNAQNYAVALGYNSKTQRWNELWKGDGASTNLKGYGVWQWHGDTATATPTELLLGGTTNKRGILLANSAIGFDIDIIAVTTAGGDCAIWNIKGLIKRGALVGSTAIVGTPVVTVIAKDTGAALWDAVVSADTTNGALVIIVTGATGVTIGWVATNKVFTERRF